jgi:hypothetical protein
MGSLALRLACLPYKASPAELLPLTLAQLLVERAIYKISSFQNIRSARLILAHRSTQRFFSLQNPPSPSPRCLCGTCRFVFNSGLGKELICNVSIV